MAIRNVRVEGDEILRKKSREVDVIKERELVLLKDMADTMKKEDGVGLAAPQVGVLKRIIVIDVGEGLIELINPKIVSLDGEVLGKEGCLSVPGIMGEVVRPKKVVVEALNPKGEAVVIEGDGLLARVLCHEIDHLDGILFLDKAVNIIDVDDDDK